MERVRFITYRGRQILFVDYSELQKPDEILQVIEQVKQRIAQEPENSVLLLSYVRETKTDSKVNQAMKELAAHNKPYVKASAVVGMSTVFRLVYDAVRLFSRRENFCAFDDLAPAKEWLVEQDAAVAV